jgi:hypothetical protein
MDHLAQLHRPDLEPQGLPDHVEKSIGRIG